MSRFLFTVPPLAGHINPAAAVAAELGGRGHDVAWAGRPALIDRLTGGAFPVHACAGPDVPGERPPGIRGLEALKFLWEAGFGPLAEAMASDVEAAVRAFRPDVVVADQQTVAGALVAERLGLPYATSCTTTGELLGAAGLPKVEEWILELLTGLRARFGDPAARHDPRFSPWLTLVYSTPELVGAHPARESPLYFVGPAFGDRPGAEDFPWEWLAGDVPTVLVSLGTVNGGAGARFLAECVAAVRARAGAVRAVVADPAGVLDGEAPGPDVLVLRSVPQTQLLGRVRAVVCHAGHNTVTEALWHGLPLVVAPIRDDQPVVAGQVTEAGAGVRLRFGRVDRERIGAAIDAALGDPGLAAGARRVAASFRAAGGAGAAADRLEKLAAGA
ncbi:glycosyltransferase [Streptomyces radicis]|uniref:Glycosyltransferase n=1 Tax=Streptomyces radicis TaxID=1750517 RepID=A0A3A9W6C3_9ACTN|nr:glycosyltransferase [Streptomyces radicis]RKN08359.1 glycosyltransferase [Streptomyces radicis]RKN21605.1 glycosyltransferase [Streptomyces radicis]